MTSVLSISHRAAGYALAVGIVMVVWLLVAAASGAEAYGFFNRFAASPLGMLMVFGWSVALFYHMCNGVRHMFWDMGFLFRLENAYRGGYAVIAMTLLLTVVFWWAACPWAVK